jgi:hypothetical protein
MKQTAVLISMTLLACANTSRTALPPAPEGFVLVREYVDSFKTDKGDEYRKVQIGWDYQQQVAVEKFFELSGEKISEKALPGLTLRATDTELTFAYALVRQHPSLEKRLKTRKDAEFFGGFSLREPEGECVKGSRCIHVIVSGGVQGQENIAHAIVDLASRRVVNPNYQGQFPQGIAPK